MRRLTAQLKDHNHTKWNEDVACGSPHAAVVPLFNTEVEARRRELQQLTRNSLAWRAFTYFMSCFACQTFWTAIATYAITRGITDPAGWFISAAAYSGAAVLLSVLYGSGPYHAPGPTGREKGCKSCGK